MLRKNYLYIHLNKGYGGAERRLARVLQGLSANDNWKIIFLGENEIIEKFCRNENISRDQIVILQNELSVIKYLLKNEINIVWFINFDKVIFSFLCLKIFRRKSTKTVMTIANFYFSRMIFPSTKMKIAFKFIARRVSIIDCLYPSSIHILKTNFKRSQIYATPVPFTKNEFVPRQKENIICYASRFIKEKNPIKFLQAIKNIKDELSHFHYKVYMCGTGALEEEIEKYIKDNNLSDLIELKGFVSTEDILPYSKVYIAIMSGENYPSQSLIEAISCGNYCIVGRGYDSDLIAKPEFSEIIDITVDNIENAIIRAIRLCEHDDEKIVNNAYEFAKKTFSIEKSIEYYKKLFD